MSVGYRLDYDIKIKGSRKDLQSIPALLKEQCNIHQDAAYMVKHILSSVEDCLTQEGNDLVWAVYTDDDDCTHGVNEIIFNTIATYLPQLEFAIFATWEDFECGGPDFFDTLYFPVGDKPNPLLEGYVGGCRRAQFPQADWIPAFWHDPDYVPPFAKAEGTLTPLGEWAPELYASLEQALQGESMKTCLQANGIVTPEAGFFQVMNHQFAFKWTGELAFNTLTESFDVAFGTYFQDCTAFFQTMLEQQLILHIGQIHPQTSPRVD